MCVVKRIFRYLLGTKNFRLWYPNGSKFNIMGYLDANFSSCKLDRKSTIETYQFLGDCLVSWCSKKQASVAFATCTQILWMKRYLEDYGLNFNLIFWCFFFYF